MQNVHGSLERWLKSSANPADIHRWPRETLTLEDGKIKAFGAPTSEYIRGEWPPLAYVAELDPGHPRESWLIFPCPPEYPNQTIAPHAKDATAELRLSQKARDLLREILHGHHEPELDALDRPIAVDLLRTPQGEQNSHFHAWVVWKRGGSQSTPGLLGDWELLSCVLDRLGIPPKTILDDWQMQLNRWKIAPPEPNFQKLMHKISHRLLVSKSGWLVPLSEFELHPSGIATPSVIKPASHRSVTPKPPRSNLWAALTLAGLTLGSSTLALWPIRKASEPSDAPKQTLVAPPVVMIDSAEEQSTELVRTEWSIDQASSADSIVRDSLEVNVSLASFELDAAQDPKKAPGQTEELPAPSPNETQASKPDQAGPDQAGPIGADPVGADPDAPVLIISQGQQSKEFRLGKTFSVKKAKGVFTLKLQEGLEDTLLITGPMSQELVGPSSGSWRIGRNGIDAELVLSIQSKPGSKWQIQTSVQIPSEAGGPLVTLSPGDPDAVLGRLAQYNSWLIRTADQWKFSTTGKTQRGQPSPSQMARLYTAKQKETEKAIQRWRQIEQLAVSVFDSVSVQVELHPEPIALDAPEHRPR